MAEDTNCVSCLSAALKFFFLFLDFSNTIILCLGEFFLILIFKNVLFYIGV